MGLVRSGVRAMAKETSVTPRQQQARRASGRKNGKRQKERFVRMRASRGVVPRPFVQIGEFAPREVPLYLCGLRADELPSICRVLDPATGRVVALQDPWTRIVTPQPRDQVQGGTRAGDVALPLVVRGVSGAPPA